MIGVILILNSRGDIVLSRAFREGFSIRHLADSFRLEVVATKRAERCPVAIVNKNAFLHMRFGNMFLVAVTNRNADVGMCFQYLLRLLQIFQSYFQVIDEDALRENFTAVQQLLDESVDYGYPQLTEVDLLRSFITTAGARTDLLTKKKESEQITVKATGKIPWRSDGIVYAENELYVDVLESINLLMSQSGQVLQREVVGRVVIKAYLSGMPECYLVINDQRMIDQARSQGTAAPASGATTDPAGVDHKPVLLDDVTFHSCVQLGRFEADRSICFVPPDGECVLMRYRSTENVNPLFRVASSHVKEIAKTRMEVDFLLKAEFNGRSHATNVVVRVPCPSNTATVKVRTQVGKAKYDTTTQEVVWKMKRVQGGSETPFSCEIELLQATLRSNERAWARPPITMQFHLGNTSASGLECATLRINEPRLGYTAKKWVRYSSTAGSYQIRL